MLAVPCWQPFRWQPAPARGAGRVSSPRTAKAAGAPAAPVRGGVTPWPLYLVSEQIQPQSGKQRAFVHFYSSARVSSLPQFWARTSSALTCLRGERGDTGQPGEARWGGLAPISGTIVKSSSHLPGSALCSRVGERFSCLRTRLSAIGAVCSRSVPQIQRSPPPRLTSSPGHGLSLTWIPPPSPLTF